MDEKKGDELDSFISSQAILEFLNNFFIKTIKKEIVACKNPLKIEKNCRLAGKRCFLERFLAF